MEQVEAAASVLAQLERVHGLEEGSIGLEFMIEVTSAMFGPRGELLLPAYVRAGGDRLRGVHLGVYDYTASYEVPAHGQSMVHPACDDVRGLMRVALSGTGLTLSAGSTNRLPFPEAGQSEREAVQVAWRTSHDQIRHVLERGYYHGWDLHPGQLPVRFATCYRFFLEGLDAAASRLRAFLESTEAASDGAAVVDDAATGEAWLAFFRRAHRCGAITHDELERTGLTPADLELGSFADVLRARAATSAG